MEAVDQIVKEKLIPCQNVKYTQLNVFDFRQINAHCDHQALRLLLFKVFNPVQITLIKIVLKFIDVIKL
jgi:hypothetical protein